MLFKNGCFFDGEIFDSLFIFAYKTAYTWNLICLKSKFKIKTTKKQVNKKGATLILA